MYPLVDGRIECCGCGITDAETFRTKGYPAFDTKKDALEHLYEHRKVGDLVPEYAIDKLKEQIEDAP